MPCLVCPVSLLRYGQKCQYQALGAEHVVFSAETSVILRSSLPSAAFKNLSYEATVPSECNINSCACKGSAFASCGHCLQEKELQGHAKETLPGCIVCHASDYGQLVPPSAAAEGWEG